MITDEINDTKQINDESADNESVSNESAGNEPSYSIEVVKIPVERIKVFLETGGKIKKLLESKCSVHLHIKPGEDDIEISGNPTNIFFAGDVIRAIGRGFTPEIALRLLNQDYNLIILPLREVASSPKNITRLKGRVIGENGKIKLEIESATDSFLCIYGNTIGIVAKIDTMTHAREAVMMLLEGAPHVTVINYLSRIRREIYEARLRGI